MKLVTKDINLLFSINFFKLVVLEFENIFPKILLDCGAF